jgi:hypothetical protein
MEFAPLPAPRHTGPEVRTWEVSVPYIRPVGGHLGNTGRITPQEAIMDYICRRHRA